MLEERLLLSNLAVTFGHGWSALPTITATAKPAFMPLAEKLGGPLKGAEFESREKAGGKALNHNRFKQLLVALGISVLESEETGSQVGCAWTELGSLDTYGHEQGAKLAWRVKEQQKRIGAAEFRNTHFSFTMIPDGIEQFIFTPELHSKNSIGTDPLPAGQIWALSPGGSDENPGLFHIEVTEGPGSGVKILNRSPPLPDHSRKACAA